MIEDKLNLTYYKGTDTYSDGDVEDEILKAVEDYEDPVELLMKESSWPFLYHLSPIRENVLEWYDFDPEGSLLEIGSGCGAVTGLFCRKLRRVVGIDLSKRRSLINASRNKNHDNLEIMVGNFEDVVIEEKFDYVTLIGVLEYSIYYIHGERPFETMLEKARSFLKPGGKLIIAIENKYGMKYWAGAREDHTGRLFDSLHNYKGVEKVRTFSRDGLEAMLKEAGFRVNDFYYPMPDYKLPEEIYSDHYLPGPGALRHTAVSYDRDRYQIFNEAEVFDGICADGKFPFFANSFLVISSLEEKQGETGATVYAKFNRGRAPQFQTETLICESEGERCVIKKALYEAGKEHVQSSEWKRDLILRNYPGIQPVEVETDPAEGKASYPYVRGESASSLLLKESGHPDRLIEKIRNLADQLLQVSEEARAPFAVTQEFLQVFGEYIPEEGQECPGVSGANIDLIFDNLIQCDGSWRAIDYEWTFNFLLPVNYIRYRAFYYFYDYNYLYMKDRIDRGTFLTRLGISKKDQEKFLAMEEHFLQYVHGKNRAYLYTANYAKPDHNLLPLLTKSGNLDGEIQEMRNLIKAQKRRIKDLKQTNRDLKNSLSWKMTRPVRAMADLLTRK